MFSSIRGKNVLHTVLVALSLTCGSQAQATIVEVTTNLGKFEINLYDESTPVTVKNFLNYVSSGRYDGTVIHRSAPGFVIQGGGFVFEQQLPLKAINTNAAIVNEPKWSNVRGTVAMAKLPGNPDSATSQWFVNLANNSGGAPSLDTQNEGFTVFGQISSTDMAVVDAIAALSRFNFPGIQDLPLRNYSNTDRDDNKPLQADNLITIESVVVVDARPDTVAGLTLVPNTSAPPPATDSSAGSLGWFALLPLGLLAFRRRRH